MNRRKKKELDYAYIAIKVEVYSVRADAGNNSSLLGTPRYIDDEEKLE